MKLEELLAKPARSTEIRLVFEADGRVLEAGGTVPSWKTFNVDGDQIVSNFDGRTVGFDPEIEVQPAALTGEYEGVDTYIMVLNTPVEDRQGPLLWPRFRKHVAQSPKSLEDRWSDTNEKIAALYMEITPKNVADVIMGVTMLASEQGINVELALWNRNRELLERMIATGSPLNPEK